MMCMALLPEMLAEPSIWRRYHSPRVSPSIERLLEGLDALGEVAAHDHRVRPQVADQVGGEVGGQRGQERTGPDSSGWTT